MVGIDTNGRGILQIQESSLDWDQLPETLIPRAKTLKPNPETLKPNARTLKLKAEPLSPKTPPKP